MSRNWRLIPGRQLAFMAAGLLLSLPPSAASGSSATLAILELGDTATGVRATEALTHNMKFVEGLGVIDSDEVNAAARGSGYKGSLNLSLEEAENLGTVVGTSFYITGVARTSRRSPSTGPAYFESAASLFLVSSRSGRLIKWQRLSFQAPTSSAAEKLLLDALKSVELRNQLWESMHDTQTAERKERATPPDANALVLIDASTDEATPHSEDIRLPRPYRRLLPAYPQTAASEEIEAVVDVLVDLDSKGEVTRAEIARWAGYGIDEAALETVRRLHFFPAMVNGTPVPIRVLLRYNFRKPATQGASTGS